MKTPMTTLQEAAELEAAMDRVQEKREAACAKQHEKYKAAFIEITNKYDALDEATIAKFSPESVALYRRLQSEKAKAAEGKAP